MKNIETRRSEAKERQQEYNVLTTSQKLLKLDLRFGKDVGAKRERSKLYLKLAKEKDSKEEAPNRLKVPKKKNQYQKPKRS